MSIKRSKSSKIDSKSSKSLGSKKRNSMAKQAPRHSTFDESMLNKQLKLTTFNFKDTTEEFPISFREDIQIPINLGEILDALENTPSIITDAISSSVVFPFPELLNSIGDPDVMNDTPNRNQTSKRKSIPKSASRPRSASIYNPMLQNIRMS